MMTSRGDNNEREARINLMIQMLMVGETKLNGNYNFSSP
jgi:hypothetical protein